MARMHRRRKGKSGSKKPLQREKPNFLTYNEEEIEGLIVKLRKEENSPSNIGLILRDSYGIPSVKDVVGKKIGYFLEKNNLKLELPEDLGNLMKTAINLREHLEKNKRDVHNTRNLKLIESKIRRLAKYYKREGKLLASWRYEPKKL